MSKKVKKINNMFYFGYYGNKRSEMNEMDKFIDLNNMKYIVEPFCGSAAFSRHCYNNRNFSGKFILNDADAMLIKFLRFVKKNSSKPIVEYYNNFIKKATKEIFQEEIKHKNDNIFSFFIFMKYFNYRRGIYPLVKKINLINHNDYFQYLDKFFQDKNVELYNREANDLIKLCDNKNMFLFFDPPYYASDNSFYQKVKCADLTEIYIKIKEMLDNYKSKILTVQNSNAITRYIYHDYIVNTVEKIYESTRRKIEHITITNY
jgi:hypothetical protein